MGSDKSDGIRLIIEATELKWKTSSDGPFGGLGWKY